jgi:ribosomal protein S18 acetylase RimI-like enzyme
MLFKPESDPQRMLDLVLAYPDSQFHVVDLPYRLCSWALSDSQNVKLWEDDQGHLLGWAVAQRPFAALDYAMWPDVPDLEDTILTWGKQRWQQIANERQEKVYFFTGVCDDQPERIQRLEAHGFEQDDWSLSHMVRPMTLPLPDVSLPDGYTIRPLAGASEVATYTALHRLVFGSTNMTEDWRAQTLTMPQYWPDLDLVAVAPDQTVVGFCIGWLATVQGQITGQVEPIGVHPEYQGLGLGHLLIVEGLRRMQALGAVTALIEAYSTNDVSQHLYHTLGFETAYEAQAYAMVLKG